MREKVLKLVVAFPDTTDAMAAEKYYQKLGMPGRLIPLPAAVSAGCGLAWCADREEKPRFEALIPQAPLPWKVSMKCFSMKEDRRKSAKCRLSAEIQRKGDKGNGKKN